MTENEHPDRYEVKTLAMPVDSDGVAERELAAHLNDGWEIIDFSTVSMSTRIGSRQNMSVNFVVNRIVTLKRETETFRAQQASMRSQVLTRWDVPFERGDLP
jgi:hypothetical protein